jgi:hypothetical protein
VVPTVLAGTVVAWIKGEPRKEIAMGTASKSQTTKTETETKGSEGLACVPGVGSPITNEAYDVLRALSAKLEGLEAYRKYAKDGNEELWQKLTKSDVECVRALCDQLEGLVRDGKLQLKEPGRANVASS